MLAYGKHHQRKKYVNVEGFNLLKNSFYLCSLAHECGRRKKSLIFIVALLMLVAVHGGDDFKVGNHLDERYGVAFN
jgi:hypothetical protein